MRVLVMGAGAVGGYYGAALAGRGHAVTFVARGEHLRAMRERGLTIRSGGRVTPRVESIAAALRDAGAEVRVTTDVTRAVWEKFIRLAPGATLTSACQASIGEVRNTPESAALYRALVAETVAVGRALGVRLPADAVETAMGQIQSLPADMKTSMQLDYERRRRVELEELTGAVVRLGRRLDVPTPAYDVAYAVLKVRAGTFGGLG